MLGKSVELLVNLPQHSKGSVGEVVAISGDVHTVEMCDGLTVLVMPLDFTTLKDEI